MEGLKKLIKKPMMVIADSAMTSKIFFVHLMKMKFVAFHKAQFVNKGYTLTRRSL